MANPQGIVQTDSMNKSKAKHVHNRSRFNDSLSYRKSFTARFGEYVPSFEMNGVPSDSVSVNSHDLIDSLSLKAPFKGTIRKVKESFSVPNMAILPFNWDRIYTQPTNGDDVPYDANCVLENFPQLMSVYWKKFYELVPTTIAAWPSNPTLLGQGTELINVIVKTLILGEYIYSNGSLLNLCGYKAGAQWHFTKDVPFTAISLNDERFNPVTYDCWFDNVIRLIFPSIVQFQLNVPVGSSFERYLIRSITGSGESPQGDPDFYCSFRFFLEKMRENPASFISDIRLAAATTETQYMTNLAALAGSTTNGVFESGKVFFYLPVSSLDPEDYTDMSSKNLNLSRLLAYQLVCAHFYTNSSIDIIFSAELYRQYMNALFRRQYNTPANAVNRSFSWNGMLCPYDFLSEHYLARTLYLKTSATDYTTLSGVSSPSVASLTDATDSNYDLTMARLAAFAAIFGFRKSLRFGDYFVGSRPRPLAPFNTDVAVSGGMVSVVDVTRKQWAQKFANAVMRSRQKVEDYVGDLFGSRPAPDYHNPFFLSREQESIFGDEVQNTGASQAQNANSRTALFASQAGRFTFTFHNDDMHPCIYLQIISFDVRRAYTRSVDRQFLELSRYDMFNPDFQYIGDQPVYGIELGYHYGSFIPNTFGYQSRDMEYKQRFDVACGGFVENLPGWLMTDRLREFYQPNQLNPDFIRSFSCEFDQFYLALTGFSLGSYFHFAIITDNNVDATRPMAVDPQILE